MTNEEIKNLQEQIADLKAEIAKLNAQNGNDADAKAMTVLDAMDETTEDRDLKVETLCRWAAARAGAIVIAPLVGTVALMANEVYLVSRIARIYDGKLKERAVLACLGAMGSQMAGNLLTTLIPFSVIQVPVAVGITYSLGRVTQRWLRDGMPSDMTPYIEMFGEWKEKAKVTIMSCLWQMAIWTASGRLIYPMTPQTVFTLKRWPNLTRLAHVPESMRLSAFLTKTSVNLNILYKVMPLEMPDILNYLSATYITGFLATDTEFATDANNTPSLNEQIDVNSKDVPETAMSKEAQKVAGPSKEQPRGLLQRLMRKLLGKS